MYCSKILHSFKLYFIRVEIYYSLSLRRANTHIECILRISVCVHCWYWLENHDKEYILMNVGVSSKISKVLWFSYNTYYIQTCFEIVSTKLKCASPTPSGMTINNLFSSSSKNSANSTFLFSYFLCHYLKYLITSSLDKSVFNFISCL